MPARTNWQSATLDAAIDDADELILEIADGDQVDEAALFRSVASDEVPGEPLGARVGRNLSGALAKAVAQSGLRRIQLDRMEDWAAAIMIGNGIAQKTGVSRMHGIEPALDARFRIAEKPVSGLETTAAQFAMFDDLPGPVQRGFLVHAIAGAGREEKRMNDLIGAWMRGDTGVMENLVIRDLKAVPGLAPRLLYDRNRRWAKVLARRLARPGTVMVAVGTAHLIGDHSVQAELAAATGLKAERVQ